MSRILGSNAFWRNVAGFLPAITWAIVVIILSLTSVTMIPKVGWTDFAGVDKLGHLVFYCILALWIVYGFFRLPRRYKSMIWWSVLICACFGVAMELLQGMMRSGRQFEYPDIAANVAGACIALLIYKFKLKKKYHARQ